MRRWNVVLRNFPKVTVKVKILVQCAPSESITEADSFCETETENFQALVASLFTILTLADID